MLRYRDHLGTRCAKWADRRISLASRPLVATWGHMRGRIIRVGNSRGVRLPAPLLEQTGLDGEVEIEANGNALVIRPRRRPREGWNEAFAQMAARGDDELLDLGRSPGTRVDAEEWESQSEAK